MEDADLDLAVRLVVQGGFNLSGTSVYGHEPCIAA